MKREYSVILIVVFIFAAAVLAGIRPNDDQTLQNVMLYAGVEDDKIIEVMDLPRNVVMNWEDLTIQQRSFQISPDGEVGVVLTFPEATTEIVYNLRKKSSK